MLIAWVVVLVASAVIGLVAGAYAWHVLRCAWRESSMLCTIVTLSPIVSRVLAEQDEEREARRLLAGKAWVE
jgi:hypothetical protein